MNAQEGTRKFQEADALFRQGRFQESHALIEELMAVYPNTKNLLYSKALCLANLGKPQEADNLCDYLIRQFRDPRAQALKTRIAAEAAPADQEMPALDDDWAQLMAPVKKSPATQAPSSSFALPRYALVAAAVLVLAIGGGLAAWKLKGSLGGKSLEAAEAEVAGLWDKVESYTAAMTMDMPTVPGAAAASTIVHGAGSTECLKKDGQLLYRFEVVMSMKMGPKSMDQTMLGVFDGKDFHMQMDMMGKTTVMKSKPDPASGMLPGSGKDLFNQLHTMFDLTVLPDDTVDGKPASVFGLTLRTDAPNAAIAQAKEMFGKGRIYFAKDSGVQLMMVLLDKSNAPLLTLRYKDIIVNASVSPDHFKYTPPPGAQVIDASSLPGLFPRTP